MNLEERMADRLRGIFSPETLRAITPPWAIRNIDPHRRLAASLIQAGFTLTSDV